MPISIAASGPARQRATRYIFAMKLAALFVLLIALAAPAWAQATGPFEANAGQGAWLREIKDGSTLALDDGRSIKLAALHIPRTQAAEVALHALLGAGEIRVLPITDHTDRYGRSRAHVFAADGRWAQAFLVAQGLARVDTQADERLGAAELLALEAAARTAQRGLWNRAEYRVRAADEAGRLIDTFQIVEGRVARVERRSGRTKLVLSEGPSREFGVIVAPAARRLFTQVGLDLPSLDGKLLRVRGWIKYRNGAFIDITHPEQIEHLEP